VSFRVIVRLNFPIAKKKYNHTVTKMIYVRYYLYLLPLCIVLDTPYRRNPIFTYPKGICSEVAS